MGNIYDAFQTSSELESEGIWFDIYSPDGGPVGKVRCKPADGDMNSAYRAAAARLLEQMARVGERDDLTDMILIYAESVIVDWEGFTDRDGDPVPFSKQAVIKVMTELPQLFRTVQRHARNWMHWRRQYREELVENS